MRGVGLAAVLLALLGLQLRQRQSIVHAAPTLDSSGRKRVEASASGSASVDFIGVANADARAHAGAIACLLDARCATCTIRLCVTHYF